MKIVTFNVNGLRPRAREVGGLKQLLDSFDAHVICFQETKVARPDLTADIAVADGYESFFAFPRGKLGRSGYSGVATFCRTGGASSSSLPALPVAADEGFTGVLHLKNARNGTSMSVKESLGGEGRVGYYDKVWEGASGEGPPTRAELEELDGEGRCLVTDHGAFVLFNVYGPCVQPDDEARAHYKWSFFETMQRRWEPMLAAGRRVVVLGDLNIAPARVDSCKAGPDFEASRSRQWLQSQLSINGGPFHDIFRHLHPSKDEVYTCFSMASGAAAFNYGSRIDLILAAGPCHCTLPLPTPRETSAPLPTPRESPYPPSPSDTSRLDHRATGAPGAVKTGGTECPGGVHSFAECEFLACEVEAQLAGCSDHRPVAAVLAPQGEFPVHKAPPLSTRYMPELRGRQTRLLGFFGAVSATENEKPPVLEFPAQSPRLCIPVNEPVEKPEPSLAAGLGSRRASSAEAGASGRHLVKGGSVVGKKGGQAKGGVQSSLKSFFGGASPAVRLGGPGDASPGCGVDAQPVEAIEAPRAGLGEEPVSQTQLVAGSTKLLSEGVSSKAFSRAEETGSEELSDISEGVLKGGKFEIDPGGGNVGGVAAEWARIRSQMQAAVPRCFGHGEPCVSRVVKKAGPNLGRGFYVCARAQGPSTNPEARCDHFEWQSNRLKGASTGATQLVAKTSRVLAQTVTGVIAKRSKLG